LLFKTGNIPGIQTKSYQNCHPLFLFFQKDKNKQNAHLEITNEELEGIHTSISSLLKTMEKKKLLNINKSCPEKSKNPYSKFLNLKKLTDSSYFRTKTKSINKKFPLIHKDLNFKILNVN
jgi:hypothetical protein